MTNSSEREEKARVVLKDGPHPQYRSEARGWLARVQTTCRAIKPQPEKSTWMNVNRRRFQTSVVNTPEFAEHELSVTMAAGSCWDHIDEYFDTPEHAAFAIQLATNPR